MMFQGIQTGEISMVIGTHSLIAESVEFLALRIAVVDEQHRFGVIQRGRFNSKVVHISLFRILIWLWLYYVKQQRWTLLVTHQV